MAKEKEEMQASPEAVDNVRNKLEKEILKELRGIRKELKQILVGLESKE